MKLFTITAAIICLGTNLFAQTEQYQTNPYEIPVSGSLYFDFGDHFMAADINGDGAVDYLYRTATHLWAYDHYSTGDELWSYEAAPLDTVNGTTFTVADIDGDFQAEVILLDDANVIHVVNGLTGLNEQTCALDTIGAGLGDYQRGGYISVANLRGHGDRDIIVQTVDARSEVPDDDGKQYFYINRSLIAINLAEPRGADMQLWRVDQDRNTSEYYEGYWGQAHGAFFCADVDADGLDEVVGGTFVDHNGTVSTLSGYDDSWVIGVSNFVDHIDCISVGDYRPETAGLEWAITEEGPKSGHQNTVFLSLNGKIWEQNTLLYSGNDDEPQNIAVGNFDATITKPYVEFWNRSRFPNWEHPSWPQHPWVYDYAGNEYADYAMDNILPADFNSEGNAQGLEMIWTIDWDGSGKEYIAAKARHVHGHVGIFDAINGSAKWTTMSNPNMQAKNVYVADVAGDSREEIVIFDTYDNKIKIFHNTGADDFTRPSKWDDPLYRRLKQNWSYYSPGSYTAREPVQAYIKVFLEGPYSISTHNMTTSINNSIPATSPYIQDPRTVDPESIPANAVDWVLVEIRQSFDGTAVISRSAFLEADGDVVDEFGNNFINLFAEKNASYYIVVKHRNHLAVMSADVQSFSAGSVLYDFTDYQSRSYEGKSVKLEDNVWGMYAGDADGSGTVDANDRSATWNYRNSTGYLGADCRLSSTVDANDRSITWNNRNKATSVPDS